MGILKTKFDAFIAGPLADLLSFLNKSLSADATAGQFREFRNSLKGSQKEFFEEQLKELRGTSGRSSGPITTAIMEEMLKRFQQTPNVISKGKSDKKLTPEAQLGVDRLADLDKEIEKATLKNTLSEKEFETEMRIQEIMKGTTGLTENQIKAKLDKLYVLSKEQEELQKTKELYDSIGNSIEQGIVDAINGAIEGTKTLGDVARSVFTQIQRSLVSYGVNAFLGGLPGGIGKFFSGRANGGPVSKGKTYMVGERGPELFTPGSSGKITPNHDLGGSTNVVVNVDAANTTAQGDNGQAEMLGKMLAGAVQDELLKQQRPGGILYR
jgi:phage-related minor tail protein